MARMCKVCSSPSMARRVSKLVAQGVSDAEIASPFHSLSKSAVRRHRINHLVCQPAESGVTPAVTAGVSVPKSGLSSASPRATPAHPIPTVEDVVPALRGHPMTPEALGDKLHVDGPRANALVELARERGANLHYRGGKWHLDGVPPTGSQVPHKFQLVSDADGYITFGACGDQHLCSKYERLDCLNDYYDWLQTQDVKTVLNAGNWIDGSSNFNQHDLLVHGMDPQLQYLAKNYPQRPGMTTWAITGEDHEGWWSRREGVDVGRYAETVMRDNGREDWFNVGFMETFIPLINAQSGKSSQLCLMHPGGGSAYALSYAPQKIVEGFDGGAKPAVLLIGHYHKSSYQMTRNVHVIQTGCFQDQSLFMRQKKLAAHVGGWICKAHVDPRTGAVDEFALQFRNYFVKDFYEDRWSEFGPVKPVRRSAKP